MYNIPVSFPRYFKIGRMDLVLTPSDTVIIDYENQPFISTIPDSTIRHFIEINQGLQFSRLLGIVPSSDDYKNIPPVRYKAQLDSFYFKGLEFIDNYLTQNPHLNQFFK